MEYSFLKGPVGNGRKEQIIEFYRQAGWWSKGDDDDPELLNKLIAGSHCFLVCASGDEIAGIGRALSDSVSDAYIQDVFVKPGFRKQGLGGEITMRIINKLRGDGMKWIGLIATPEAKGVYLRLGFQEINRTAMLLKTGEEVQC